MGWSQGLERGGHGGGLVQRLFSCDRRRDSLGQHTGQRPQKGQTSFPQRRGSGPGRPWLVQDKVGHGCQALGWGRTWPCFSLQTAPPQQAADCARHVKGSFLSVPPGWERGVRGKSLPSPRDGQDSRGPVRTLRGCLLTHSFAHSFICSSLSTRGSPGPVRTALITETPWWPTQDLSDANAALNRPSLSHRKRAAGPDPRHDHPLYRTRLQQGEADGVRSGRGSMRAQKDLLS